MYIENYYKNCQIKMAGKYDQLHIMTTYPTKYESYQANNLREVAACINNV